MVTETAIPFPSKEKTLPLTEGSSVSGAGVLGFPLPGSTSSGSGIHTAAQQKLAAALEQAGSSFQGTAVRTEVKGEASGLSGLLGLAPRAATPSGKGELSPLEIGTEKLQANGAVPETSSRPATATEGDVILKAMSAVREPMLRHYNYLRDIPRKDNISDTNVALLMQLEVMQYSLTVDLYAKFLGKVPQTIDTLLRS